MTPTLHSKVWWVLNTAAHAHGRQPPAGVLPQAADRIAALGSERAILSAMEKEIKRWPKVEKGKRA